MLRVRTKVTDRDHGYAKLAGDLSGAGTITLGVQGKAAEKQHGDSDLTVGQIAAIHELGLGVPERSWLRSWMDENEQLMRRDMAEAYQEIIRGIKTRKQAMEDVGYQWVVEMRDNIHAGKIRPSLSPETIAKKGHSIPLVDSGAFMNSITFRLFLKQIKGVRDAGLRAALRRGK